MSEAGLVPVLGPCVKNLRSDNIHAASINDRVSELNWAFRDQTISGVFAVCGGMGSAALLPHLDYRAIRESRKPFLGMSDITALNMGILSKAGLVNFNGQSPSIRLDKGSKIEDADSASFELTLRLLMSDEQWASRPFSFNEYFPRTVCPGETSGIAIGGNLDTFVHLIGTPFLPDLTNTILFGEDVHKTGETLSRQFLHMQLAGILRQVEGVVLGEFAEVPRRVSDKEPSIERVIEEYFAASGVPCSYGYPFSHGPLTGPIPMGAECHLDASSGDVTFNFRMG